MKCPRCDKDFSKAVKLLGEPDLCAYIHEVAHLREDVQKLKHERDRLKMMIFLLSIKFQGKEWEDALGNGMDAMVNGNHAAQKEALRRILKIAPTMPIMSWVIDELNKLLQEED